jgi:DNA-binding beta-propeller fold protein YncE
MLHRLLPCVAVLVEVLAAQMCAQAADPASPPAAAGELKVLKILEAGGSGGWDYLTVDPDARRLYVSRSTRVMVLDADDGKSLGEIADTPGVHGIALVPGGAEGFTSDGKENMIGVFDLKSLKITRKVKCGQNPDAICYDPATKKIFSFNHSGGDITIADPSAPDKAPVTIMVGGTLETGVSDGAGRVYVNVEDKDEIVVIDSKEAKVLAHWPIKPATGPTGLAIDIAHKRLYAGCSNSKMAVVDTETGKVLATPTIGAGCDGVAFDPESGLAMSSNGRDGTLTAVKEGPAGEFTAVQTLKTIPQARTIAYDSKTHHVYLPGNAPGASGAKSVFSIAIVGIEEKKAEEKKP